MPRSAPIFEPHATASASGDAGSDVAPTALPAVVQASRALATGAISADTADEVLAAGMDLGRLEAMDFVATVAGSAMLSIFESVKKSKAWKHLRNPQSCDGRNFGSLDEFCEVKLGRSYRRLQELTANRNTLGEEAFEHAQRLGLRQADFNVIKALPAPRQELVREALNEGASKEDVQRVLRELAAADLREMRTLENERDGARDELRKIRDELRAKDEVIEHYAQRIVKYQVRLHEKIAVDTDWPAALVPLCDQVAAAGRKMAQAISELEGCRITLFEVAQDVSDAQRTQYEAALGHVAQVYEQALMQAEGALGRERSTFDKSLGHFAPQDAGGC